MWKNKNVWIILIAEFIVGIGLWAGIIGNLSFMQALVPSDFVKSIILAIGMLAGVLIGPYAGKMIDKVSKRRVLMLSNVGRVLSVCFMFIAIATDSIVWMIVFLISLQLSAAFFMPALQAVIPMVAKDEELLTLNGWHMNVRTVSRIIGTAAAGFVLSYVDLYWLYVISFVMYVLMIVMMSLLEIPEDRVPSKGRATGGSFKEVWPMLKEHPVVLMTLVLTLIPLLFLGSFNLIVINLVELHDSTSLSGLLYTVEGIGFMLGAFLVKRISEYVNIGVFLFSVTVVMGILDVSLFVADVKWLAVATFACYGFTVGLFFPIAVTIFQRKVPKEYHGRFFSFRNMVDQMSFQIVLLSAGALLDLLGVQLLGVVFGGISLLLTIFFLMEAKRKRVSFA